MSSLNERAREAAAKIFTERTGPVVTASDDHLAPAFATFARAEVVRALEGVRSADAISQAFLRKEEVLTARVAELEGLVAEVRVYGWATANVPEDWDDRATAALEAQPKGETDE